MDVSLHIIYEGNVGRPLTAAKTHDRELLVQAANPTIQEAFERAELIGVVDEFVGNVRREEAERLQRVLKTMIPELEVSSAGLGKN